MRNETTGTLKISVFIDTPSRGNFGGRTIKRTLLTEHSVTQEEAQQIRHDFDKDNYDRFGPMALWSYWQADPVEIR